MKFILGISLPVEAADHEYSSGESRDNQELSPTESALAESSDRPKALIETKNPEFKVVTKVSFQTVL